MCQGPGVAVVASVLIGILNGALVMLTGLAGALTLKLPGVEVTGAVRVVRPTKSGATTKELIALGILSPFRVFAPNFALKLLEGASHLAPHAQVLRLKMEDFSRDPDWVAELEADPLTKDEVQPIATVAAFARAGERFERELERREAEPPLRVAGADAHVDRLVARDADVTLVDFYQSETYDQESIVDNVIELHAAEGAFVSASITGLRTPACANFELTEASRRTSRASS